MVKKIGQELRPAKLCANHRANEVTYFMAFANTASNKIKIVFILFFTVPLYLLGKESTHNQSVPSTPFGCILSHRQG